MISASSAFQTANAKVAKKPVFAFEIDGYHRIFTNRKVPGLLPPEWDISLFLPPDGPPFYARGPFGPYGGGPYGVGLWYEPTREFTWFTCDNDGNATLYRVQDSGVVISTDATVPATNYASSHAYDGNFFYFFSTDAVGSSICLKIDADSGAVSGTSRSFNSIRRTFLAQVAGTAYILGVGASGSVSLVRCADLDISNLGVAALAVTCHDDASGITYAFNAGAMTAISWGSDPSSPTVNDYDVSDQLSTWVFDWALWDSGTSTVILHGGVAGSPAGLVRFNPTTRTLIERNTFVGDTFPANIPPDRKLFNTDRTIDATTLSTLATYDMTPCKGVTDPTWRGEFGQARDAKSGGVWIAAMDGQVYEAFPAGLGEGDARDLIGAREFYDWIKSIDDHEISVDDLEGSSTLGDLNVTVLDSQRQLTADMPDTVFEGKTVRLKAGFAGMVYADYATLFTGRITTVPMANKDLCYTFTAQDPRVQLQKVIYLTGDDGQPTSSDHPKTLLGSPLDLMLSILSDYIGLTADQYDGDKIRAYRDELFAGLMMEFTITSPPSAKEFIEGQLMKPLGGYLRVDNLGRVTPQFFRPLPGRAAIVAALDADNIDTVPEMEQADLMNVVSFRFDKSDDKFLSEAVMIDTVSETKYGQQGQQIIESDGVKSAFQGYLLAAQTARSIFDRYGNKNPKVTTTAFWQMCLLEPGDLVYLSHALVPDRTTGMLGITNKVFEVNGRRLNFQKCLVELPLIDGSGTQLGGTFRIAPDDVPDWTSASGAQQARYMFVTDSTGHYSDAEQGNALG